MPEQSIYKLSNRDFYENILDNLYDGVYILDRERKISYWSKGAERISGFRSDEVVGHCCAENILNHVDQHGKSLCWSGCPVTGTLSDGQFREALVYLHHKNGHRLPVYVRVLPIVDGQGQITGAAEIFSNFPERKAAAEQIEQLQKMAWLDELTQISNRRYLEEQLQIGLDKLKRYNYPLGVIFVDIDRFKQINDTFGHSIGDKALQMVAKTIVLSSRRSDICGRWGGDEFLIIAPNTDRTKLHTIAERTRVLIEQSFISTELGLVQPTVSIGIVQAQSDDSTKSLLSRVDNHMYQSKTSGRNRVTVGQPS